MWGEIQWEGSFYFCKIEAQLKLPYNMIHNEILTLFGIFVFLRLLWKVISMGEAVERWLTNDLTVKEPPCFRNQTLLSEEVFITSGSNELNEAWNSRTSSLINNLLKYIDQELVCLSQHSAIDPAEKKTLLLLPTLKVANASTLHHSQEMLIHRLLSLKYSFSLVCQWKGLHQCMLFTTLHHRVFWYVINR